MKKFKIPRVFIIQAACIFMFATLLYHMFKLQIVNGQDYAEEASQNFSKVIYEKGARGNIYDCNGKVLASNKLVYTVTMADTGKTYTVKCIRGSAGYITSITITVNP